MSAVHRGIVFVCFAAVLLSGTFAFANEDGGIADDEASFDELIKEQPEALESENYYAGEVIVTGRRIANIEQSGTTTVVDDDEIHAHGDKTLDQVLDRLPGIQTYRHTKGHTRLRMRGFDQDKVAVLIDGVPINDVYSSDVDISTIPVVNVSKIIVNRGVSSALYGTDGAVGSINIVTKKPTEPFALVETEYGLYNNMTLNLAHGAPVADFYYQLTGTIMHSEGFLPSKRLNTDTRRKWFDKLIPYDLYPRDGPFGVLSSNTFEDVALPAKDQYLSDRGKWDHDHHTRYHASLKGGYAFSSNLEAGVSSYLYWYRGRTNTYQPNAYNSYRGERWKPRYPDFGDSQEQVKKFALRNRAFVWPYVYRFDVSPYIRGQIKNFSVKLNTFYLQQGSKQDGYASTDHRYFKSDSILLKGQGVYEPFHDYKTFSSVGFRVFPSYKFSKWHRLNAAIHFRHDQYLGYEQAMSEFVSPETYEIMGRRKYPVEDLGAQTISIGIEDEIRVFDRLKIAAGVSYDVQNFSHFKLRSNMEFEEQYIVKDDSAILGTRDSINPVVGLVFDVLKRRLRLRAAGAVKTRFPTLSEYSKVEDEDKDRGLRPERSYNVNGGAEVFFLNKAVSLRSDYFLSLIDDRIVKISRDDPPINIERVVSQGVETIFTADLGRFDDIADIFGSVSHTFIHARNMDYSENETANKGDYLEYTPEHFVGVDFQLKFVSDTTIGIWANVPVNQRVSVMESSPTEEESAYSTDYFTTVRLHDPVFVNFRVAQEFLRYYEVSFTVYNLTDDYRADPFNPGPGRMCYLALSAEWR